MSADAKVWQDDDGSWSAVHDSVCKYNGHDPCTRYELLHLLKEVEDCENEGQGMRWEIRQYPDGKFGLSGYAV